MKIQKTFTIEEKVWDEFNKIAKLKSINKSLLIENHMRDIINLNEDPTNFVLFGEDVEILQWRTKDGLLHTKKNI